MDFFSLLFDILEHSIFNAKCLGQVYDRVMKGGMQVNW